jgi:hypothetical protein
LVSYPEALPADAGLDCIRIAVRDFTADAAARILRERSIEMTAAPVGAVCIADPDGIRIELAAA